MTTINLTEEQIDAACEWWGNVLRNPKFDNLGDSASEASEREIMAGVFATAYHKAPDEETLSKFKAELKRLLSLRGPTSPYCSVLMCDYGPGGELHDAATIAGMKGLSLIFPWKTIMRFDNGGVQVGYGHGAPFKEILTEGEKVGRTE